MKAFLQKRKTSIPSLTHINNLPPINPTENASNPTSSKASSSTDKLFTSKSRVQSPRSTPQLDQHVKFASDTKLKSFFFKNPESTKSNQRFQSMISTKDTIGSFPQTLTSLTNLQTETAKQVITQSKLQKTSKTLLKVFDPPQQKQQQKEEEQKNTDKKLQPSPYQLKKQQFYEEVKELENLIQNTQIHQNKPKTINLQKRRDSKLFQIFQPLIQLSVLDEEYHQFSKFKGISPIILRDYRALEYQNNILQNNGTGLILVENFGVVSIMPSFNYKINEDECYKHPMDTDFLTDIMQELIQYQIKLADLRDTEIKAICKDIVLKHCYFAQNYKSEKIDFHQSYHDWLIYKKPLDQLKDHGRNFGDIILTIQLGHQQIECPEIVFNPTGKNRYQPSLQDIIRSTLKNYSYEDIQQILSNVICVGSYFHLKGFDRRLSQVLKSMYKLIDIDPQIRIFHL